MSLTFLGEARLADADVMDDRTSNASDLTVRRHNFRAQMIERDGTCVISGHVAYESAACHIIPHAKGGNVRR
jgi:hypothetical protein